MTEMHIISPQGDSPCEFRGRPAPPALNVEETTDSNSQRFGFYLVNIGSALITASLAIVVDGVSLLYVAHNGTIELVRN